MNKKSLNREVTRNADFHGEIGSWGKFYGTLMSHSSLDRQTGTH